MNIPPALNRLNDAVKALATLDAENPVRVMVIGKKQEQLELVTLWSELMDKLTGWHPIDVVLYTDMSPTSIQGEHRGLIVADAVVWDELEHATLGRVLEHYVTVPGVPLAHSMEVLQDARVLLASVKASETPMDDGGQPATPAPEPVSPQQAVALVHTALTHAFNLMANLANQMPCRELTEAVNRQQEAIMWVQACATSLAKQGDQT